MSLCAPMRGALLRLYESASVALAIDLNGRENCGSNFVPSAFHTQVSRLRQVPICWILRIMPPIEVVLTVFREARTRSLLLRSTVIQRSLGGKDESHVSRACARVVGLRRLPDHGSELWPGLWRLMWTVL